MSSSSKFKKYPSSNFLESIKRITLELERSTEVKSGEVYNRVKNELTEFISDTNYKFRFDKLREISLVLKILSEKFNDQVTFLDALCATFTLINSTHQKKKKQNNCAIKPLNT
ncbi:hypothetical protein ACLSZX_08430, partial [Avibacterium avium]|uniref:hypothetical protein n=1 Tax=Avibacterium avium TaxID=751 RepID=UPI003BF7F315